MYTTRIFTLGLLLAGATVGAYAKLSIRPASDECVSVEMAGANGIDTLRIELAKQTVTGIFAEIGVSANIGLAGTLGRSQSCVEITVAFRSNVQPTFHPGALAYAQPYRTGGTQIYVLIERILRGSVHQDGIVLGHVIAHEIGHVLEAISRHSSTGIMKATWKDTDYNQMNAHPLSFAPEDAEFIHTGFARRRMYGQPLSAVR